MSKVQTFTLDTNNDLNYMKHNTMFPHGRLYPAYFPEEVFAETPLYPGYWIGNFGTIINKETEYQLYHSITPMGYVTVEARSCIDGVEKMGSVFVHRMVMCAHDPLEDYTGMTVNHKHGHLKHINIYMPGTEFNNLEWMTGADNSRDAFVNSLYPTKYDPQYMVSGMAPEVIHRICQLFEKGLSIKEVADAVGFPFNEQVRSSLLHIRRGDVRKEITSLYKHQDPLMVYHSEGEIIAICRVMEAIKRNGLKFSADLVIACLDQYFGITGIVKSYIYDLRQRPGKWKPIIDRYDI